MDMSSWNPMDNKPKNFVNEFLSNMHGLQDSTKNTAYTAFDWADQHNVVPHNKNIPKPNSQGFVTIQTSINKHVDDFTFQELNTVEGMLSEKIINSISSVEDDYAEKLRVDQEKGQLKNKPEDLMEIQRRQLGTSIYNKLMDLETIRSRKLTVGGIEYANQFINPSGVIDKEAVDFFNSLGNDAFDNMQSHEKVDIIQHIKKNRHEGSNSEELDKLIERIKAKKQETAAVEYEKPRPIDIVPPDNLTIEESKNFERQFNSQKNETATTPETVPISENENPVKDSPPISEERQVRPFEPERITREEAANSPKGGPTVGDLYTPEEIISGNHTDQPTVGAENASTVKTGQNEWTDSLERVKREDGII
jgi:hypothetical protein